MGRGRPYIYPRGAVGDNNPDLGFPPVYSPIPHTQRAVPAPCEMEIQPQEFPCEMENQPEEFPCEMENLPKEFLNLWKKEEHEEEHRENFWEEDGDFWTDKEKEEFKREQIQFNEFLLKEKEKSKEQDAEKKIERTAWKPSEMHVYYSITDMLKNKQMEMRMKVHFEMLPIKEGHEKGVRAHNKLMAHFRHYFPEYHNFRQFTWEAFKDLHPWMAGNSYITYEDITPFSAMKYTNAKEGVPRFVYEGSSDSLQIYSVKVVGRPDQQKKKSKAILISLTQWPLEVFGVVAVRDCIDPRRNLIFYRDRDNCQIITQEDPYLELTGPTRAVGMNHDVMIEAELKVKGAVEREDKYLIAQGKTLSPMSGLGSVELTSLDEWKLNCNVGGLETCVEATIFIKVINGTWPIGVCSQIAARTNGICDKVILIESIGDDVTSSGVDRNMKQARHVVSVQASGELMVSFLAWRADEEQMVISEEEIFKAKMSGRSFCYHKFSSCKLGVLVVWSRIQPFCGDMLPESEWDLM